MNNTYDGKPSFKLPHRPYFSIIVPCYNSRKTIGILLQSIVNQNLKDDIEVILSDDCSTESYQDIVEQFDDLISIRQVKTDYNFAPGNTREKGVSIAEGEWVVFADHDDVFIDNTLCKIKDVLIQSGEKYYAISNFYEANPETGKIIKEMKFSRNWNHAKFYNLDNLWKAYDIHFKKDLLTHEDIYISSRINSAMRRINGDNPLFIDIFTYIWNSRPTTISREQYGDHSFLETFFKDYITATGYVYLEQFKNGIIDAPYALTSCIEVLLYCYFYMCGFIFHDPKNYIHENEQLCREYYVEIKRTFGIDNDFVYNYSAKNDAKAFMNVKQGASIASGPFIEYLTLKQWLNVLHPDIKRVTMTDSMHK